MATEVTEATGTRTQPNQWATEALVVAVAPTATVATVATVKSLASVAPEVTAVCLVVTAVTAVTAVLQRSLQRGHLRPLARADKVVMPRWVLAAPAATVGLHRFRVLAQ